MSAQDTAIEMGDVTNEDTEPLKKPSPEEEPAKKVDDGEDAGESAKMLPGTSSYSEGSINPDEIPLNVIPPAEDFYGLNSKELERFATDPFWVRLRWALAGITGAVWIAMLIAAIIIVVVSPKCPPFKKLDWWQKGVAYSVFPHSFMDSNGDGFGDLQGVAKSADYLENLGVAAIYLRSIYQSPQKDFGYDVSNHGEIDGMFGGAVGFDKVVEVMHGKDIKVIVEFIPGHVSVENELYMGGENLQDRFYLSNDEPADANAANIYGLPTWIEDAAKGHYYRTEFGPTSVQVNLDNEEALQDTEATLRYWLDKGVDGFRIENAESLFLNQSDVMPYQTAVNRWKNLLDQVTKDTDQKKVLILASGNKALLDMISVGEHVKVDQTLTTLQASCAPDCVQEALPTLHNAQIGSDSVSRASNRFGAKYVDAINMVALTMPGLTFVYYGEELGMSDIDLTGVNVTDVRPESRLPERSPMQWAPVAITGGFTSCTNPWLPLNADVYPERNALVQQSSGIGASHFKVFQSIVPLREEYSFQWGSTQLMAGSAPAAGSNAMGNLTAYVRSAEGFTPYLVAMNLGGEPVLADLSSEGRQHVVVKAATPSLSSADSRFAVMPEDKGEPVPLALVYLRPGDGFVGQFVDVVPDEE